MHYHEIIRRPLITEKNTMLMESNKYSFEVSREATKPQIKRAVEEVFSVTVLDVHTMNVRGKKRRRGREFGYTRSWKKAIVTLEQENTIDLFEA